MSWSSSKCDHRPTIYLPLQRLVHIKWSWWSFLVVAIVIAVVIAVVIGKVWSSPNLQICFHFPIKKWVFISTPSAASSPDILRHPPAESASAVVSNFCWRSTDPVPSVRWTSCWSELKRCQQHKEEKEKAKVVHDGKLTWKSTDWCENGHRQAFYTQRAVAKPLKLFCWMIYTPCVSATFMSPVAKYEIHEI